MLDTTKTGLVFETDVYSNDDRPMGKRLAWNLAVCHPMP
jgi:hypothetical protein